MEDMHSFSASMGDYLLDFSLIYIFGVAESHIFNRKIKQNIENTFEESYIVLLLL